jgi:hypothetical protein
MLAVLSLEAYVKQRMYTYDDVIKISARVAKEKELEVAQKYDMMYTLTIISTLTAKPFNFGKGRIKNVINMFFSQIESLNTKVIDVDQLLAEAKRVGVDITQDKGKFIIEVK